MTATLLTARAYWPSEPEIRNGAGSGLTWISLLLLAAALGIVASIVGGRFRIRFSWTDLAVIALVVLVALSSTHAIDRRPAINLGWEWIGFGIAYLLVRNLPRSREESIGLASALVATATAVSLYGLYQSKYEIHAIREAFLRNPLKMLEEAGVAPGTPGEILFRDRLFGSDEIWSTFGLANSLAGFLVGPLVVILGLILGNLVRRDRDDAGSRWLSITMAAVPTLIISLCFLLTKSRSAWLGLIAGLAVLAWQLRHAVSRRVLIGTCLTSLGLGVLVLLWGIAIGRIDREVFTESPKSLLYRLEYWQGTWGVLTEGGTTLGKKLGASTFWLGVGPGNFGPYYLLHKLPQSSEEIQDPHNMILEVWATAGLWAMLALLAALGFGLWNTLGPARDQTASESADNADDEPVLSGSPARWVIVGSGLGWVLVVAMGELNPFVGDLFARWLLLGVGWLGAVLLTRSLWIRSRVTAGLFGAGALAVMLNLLAAGGIAIPTVALGLWTLLGIGQNLRDDRPCSQLRVVGRRTAGVTAMGVWAAVVGLFLGAVVPFWNSEAAINSADAALVSSLNPNYSGAEAALEKAVKADPYSSRPWRKLAGLYMRVWQERGQKPDDLRWKQVPITLLKAVSFPRNPNVWSLHAERASVMNSLLKLVGPSLQPLEKVQYLGNVVEASRTASRLYPTNATLHARLAFASADISMFADAASEATEALRLDEQTPHLDKKLPDSLRKQIEAQLPTWKQKAAEVPIGTRL